MNQIQLIGAAHWMADLYAIDAITALCSEVRQSVPWYDTRPLLDLREVSGPSLDKMRQLLDYAHERGLISAHPEQTHLVRLTDRGCQRP